MDLGDFANYQQNNQNAENARREAERQRAEVEKLLHEQKRTNDLLQSQEAEKQLQSKLYELTSYLEVKYSQLLTENNTGETINVAKGFLISNQGYLNIADQENFSNLEYKKLATEIRSRIDLFTDKAITIVDAEAKRKREADVSAAHEEIKSDLESINTSPTEELALHLAEKYENYEVNKIKHTPRISTYTGETPESLGKKYKVNKTPAILDDNSLISSYHKELAQQAKSSLEMIRQNDWFRWGADQLIRIRNEQEIETNNRIREQKKRNFKRTEIEKEIPKVETSRSLHIGIGAIFSFFSIVSVMATQDTSDEKNLVFFVILSLPFIFTFAFFWVAYKKGKLIKSKRNKLSELESS